jgi:putative toxin-antitoxin system antitoxin component (TIGR02293 family)
MTVFTPAPGATVLGVLAQTTDDLIRAVTEGMPTEVIVRLARELGRPQEELLQLIGLSARTYARRLTEGRLTPEESERAARLARVVEAAHTSFGPQRARTWLDTPWPALNHHTPLAYARTDLGAQAVLDLIAALEDGIFV